MALRIIHSIPFLKRLYFEKLGLNWIQKKVRPFESFLKKEEKIVDIGSGNGLITHFFRGKGHRVTPVDVVDLAYNDSVRPTVYDGKTMPFSDKHFDTALLLTVLHHCEQPDAVLTETKRVAKRIIIIEDIYKNPIQKHLTFFIDSLVNLGYSDNPHTNKDDEDWRTTFKKMNLELVSVSYHPVFFFFLQAVYIVECKD